ncbi:LytR/AlgR family response regulator transcription factor [Algibacter sp. L3A6]|uniref:LytR/AlgR family response regulator transcription factor n=1 Tax=Algibacter sp. L3A6 TaxID=2686366 RepID=UPI00131A95F9|nr:LytTR family DNA-binding domain-containing protein [Algibacter sp. L3A6]
MIRYILVDDNPNTLVTVKNKIDKLPKEYELKHIESYDSSKKAFEEINEDDYDLLIVDFEMPVYNGIELAKKIATNKKIIFLTSTTNNGPKMMNALTDPGYLSKPFDTEEFEEILKDKIINKVTNKTIDNQDTIVTLAIGSTQDIRFQTNNTYYITSSRNILSIQSKKNYVNFYGAQDKVVVSDVRETINNLSKKLEIYGFVKINQSTLVNLTKFDKRINKKLYLRDCKEEFKIGETEIDNIKTKLHN